MTILNVFDVLGWIITHSGVCYDKNDAFHVMSHNLHVFYYIQNPTKSMKFHELNISAF